MFYKFEDSSKCNNFYLNITDYYFVFNKGDECNDHPVFLLWIGQLEASIKIHNKNLLSQLRRA